MSIPPQNHAQISPNSSLECPHGQRCGGCAFLGIPYPEQLRLKGSAVATDFARYPEHARLRLAPVTAATPTRAYRARAKLVFGTDGALGLFARDSHEVVDIPECRVLAPPLQRVAEAARRTLSGPTLALEGLDLRVVDAGVLVTLIAAQGTALPALKRLASALCAASPDVRSVAASFRAAESATLLGTGHVLLVGEQVEPHRLSADGPYHLAAHGAFTQAHLGQANAAHRALEGELRKLGAQRVLELYAGSGALALRLAANGFNMTAVEAFAPALAQAERAAREQGLTLTTHSGHAEHVLRELRAQNAAFDALIVNPPRRGLSPEVRTHTAALAPRAILYMSCDAATLARDLEHLRLLGYAAAEVSPFDMIPHSAAVECLVTLQRGLVPVASVLYEDAALLAVLKSGFEPVSNEPAGDGGLLERVRRLPGASEAVLVPSTRLDADCSGICVFARSPAHLPQAERACARAAHRFTALARGVSHKQGSLRRPVRTGRRTIPACTRYERVAVHGGHSLLTLTPENGNPAIVRQHLAGVAHPVLGDTRWGDAASNGFFEHRHGLDRSFLHRAALTLALDTGPLTLEAPLPGELAAVLASLSDQAAASRQ
jgi:23S rRNA (uracil1939-C5)-methyltransferase